MAWLGGPLALASAALFGASIPLTRTLIGAGWIPAGSLASFTSDQVRLAVVTTWSVRRTATESEPPTASSDLPALALVVLCA